MAALVSSTPSPPFSAASIAACLPSELSQTRPAPHAAERASCHALHCCFAEPRAPAHATERSAAFGQGAPHARGTYRRVRPIRTAPDAATDTLCAPRQAAQNTSMINFLSAAQTSNIPGDLPETPACWRAE